MIGVPPQEPVHDVEAVALMLQDMTDKELKYLASLCELLIERSETE